MSDKHEIVPFQPQHQLRRSFSLMPSSLGEAMELAKMIADSDMAPKDYKNKPSNVLIAIQMGADVGLKPMQSIQNIAVINGRPSIWGDAALGLVQASGEVERFHETLEGEGQKRSATCIAKRKGWPDEIKRTFSWEDAQRAGLIGKSGPWTTYESRMMQMRARSWVLRDGFADILVGLSITEEAMDISTAIDVTPMPTQLTEGSNPLDRIPEGMRDNVEKAFAALSFSQAQALAKINEYLGKDGVDPEEASKALLVWCRDEYAKRKTGQGVAPKKVENGNAKAVPQAPATPAESSHPVTPTVTVDSSAPEGSRGDTPPPSELPRKEVPVSEIPWARGELF